MRNIIVIAKNTFRETIRDRILYGILGFAALYILLDLFMARLALGDLVMIKSFGLAGIYLFGLMITIFLGASILYKEIERRTLYFVLSKPVSRRQVILGKFAGLFTAVIFTTALMAVIYLAVIFYEGGGFDYLGLLAIFMQVVEMGLFIALLIFFSSFAAPMTSTVCAVLVLFSGHLLDSVLKNSKLIGGLTYRLIKAAYYVLPNLEKFNIRNIVVHRVAIMPASVLWAVAYAVFYSVLLLFFASVIFKKREL